MAGYIRLALTLSLIGLALQFVTGRHTSVGTYSSYSWIKDPALFSPWLTETGIEFETVCATACSNEHRRGRRWCTGYQYDGSAKTCKMFPVSKEDVELVPDPANPPAGRPIFKARTEDLSHTSNYVFWSPSCNDLNSAIVSNYLDTGPTYYCDATFAEGLITDKEVEVVVSGQSPLENLDSAPSEYVEETDVLVSCCGKFRDSPTNNQGECWAKKLNLKNGNGPEKWKGPYPLQYSTQSCNTQKVGSKVIIMTQSGGFKEIEYFDTTDFTVKTLLDTNGANVYVGVDANTYNLQMCLVEADFKTMLTLGGGNRPKKADALNVDTGMWTSLPDFSADHEVNPDCGMVMLNGKLNVIMIGGSINVIEFLDWETKSEWKTITGIQLPGPGTYSWFRPSLLGSIGDDDRECDWSVTSGSSVTHCKLPDGAATNWRQTGHPNPGSCPWVPMSAHIFKPCFISE